MPSEPCRRPGHIPPENSVKVLLVGDVDSGMTSLCNALKGGDAYSTPYVEVAVESGEKVCLFLEEAPCQPHYSAIRSVSYADAGSVLLCFNITDEKTLSGIEETWHPEVRKFNPVVPVFLVGYKWSDDTGEVAVTSEQAEALLNKISGVKYFECTADNAEEVAPVLLKTVATSICKVLPAAAEE